MNGVGEHGHTRCGGSSDLALREPQSHGLSSGSTVMSLASVLPKVVIAAIRSLELLLTYFAVHVTSPEP